MSALHASAPSGGVLRQAAAKAMHRATLALADAQQRLGKPGRPKKPVTDAPRPASADARTQTLTSRLLDLDGSSQYLCLSKWTIRDLEAVGELRRVRISLGPAREIRKLLFDRQDLDALIEKWKAGA